MEMEWPLQMAAALWHGGCVCWNWNVISVFLCTWSLWSSSFFAVRSWSLVLLSCTASSVAFKQSWRGSALASKSFIWDTRFWNKELWLWSFVIKISPCWIYFENLTCKLVSRLWRLDIILFQSSRAVFILTRTASTLSFAATLQTSSPFNTTVFTLDWPCSLSFKNS